MILQFQIERKNKIENSSRTAWGVNLISKSTMLYIAFNLIAISYTVKIMEHFFYISKEDYFVGFIIAIIVFIEHVPICMLVIRRFPILIGRRK